MHLNNLNTQNYILFKISALGLFLKYSQKFTNLNLDILIKHILIKKKSAVKRIKFNFIIREIDHAEFVLKKF